MVSSITKKIDQSQLEHCSYISIVVSSYISNILIFICVYMSNVLLIFINIGSSTMQPIAGNIS